MLTFSWIVSYFAIVAQPENIFVKNNLYKLGDFGLANAFTTNGEITSAADIEEGDSRYMSKDLLESNRPKDLTKVSGSQFWNHLFVYVYDDVLELISCTSFKFMLCHPTVRYIFPRCDNVRGLFTTTPSQLW